MIKKITPRQFITKRKKLNDDLNKMIKQVDVLNNQYVKAHCKTKIGHVFDLPPEAKEGYQQFRVDKITPVINELTGSKFEIGFSYAGVFISEGKEPLKGNLKMARPETKPDLTVKN